MRILMALVVPLILLAVYYSGLDTEDAQADDAERYSMSETDGGYLRLDKQTGAVSFCEDVGGSWVCKTAADDLLAYEKEMQRLDQENEQLDAENQRLSEQLGQERTPRENEEMLSHNGERYVFTMELPNRQDFQKGVDAMGEIADDVATGFEAMIKSMKERMNSEE